MELNLGALWADLTSLATQYAQAVTNGTEVPTIVEEANLGEDDDAQMYLTRARVLSALRAQADATLGQDIGHAIERGASYADIAAALMVSRQAAEKRWGFLGRYSGRVAVVISRRDRVHHDTGDARGRYGEVGGSEQYDADRSAWPIGKAVRELARHAIVAVDGTVRRVYAIDPDGWNQISPTKWEFTAVGDRPCTQEEIDAAHTAGELPLRPGDDCPTKPGGAYRPQWW